MKHNWQKDENGNVDEWAWEAGYHNGVYCVDCGKTVCVHCNPDYMELDDCTGPEPETITNADRIRAMSDEELAEFIDKCEAAGYNDSSIARDKNNQLMNVLDWLQQPAEEILHG